MINLTSEELKKLEIIGSGNFGVVYRNGDKVYKIYNNIVKSSEHMTVPNPSLRFPQRRLNRLMKLDDFVKHTDLVQDTIFVDGKFKGVVMPYYDGTKLSELRDESLEKKLIISKAIVRNAKELTKHFIYPTDYRLNNIMIVGDEVKIIDLDDYLTKVKIFPNTMLCYESITCLDTMLKFYLDEYRSYFPGERIFLDKLGRKKESLNFTYNRIEKYIKRKSIKHNYIFMTDDTDIQKYKEILRNPNYRVVYVYSKGSGLVDKLNQIFSLEINIYDIVDIQKIKRYLNNISFDECLEISENKVLKIEKNVKKV